MALSEFVRLRLQQAFGITRDEIAAANEFIDAMDSKLGLVVPANSDISGTYVGGLLCEGDANIVGNLTVEGDLYVQGDLTGTQGFSLTTTGDCIVAGDLNLDTDSPTAPQGDVNVGGNLRCSSFTFNPNTGVPTPNITVIGDFTTFDNEVDCSGNDGASACNISVYGDMVVAGLSLQGGDSTNALNAGNGGNLFVQGNFFADDFIDLYGGDSDNDGFNAGNGGSLLCEGDFLGGITLYGGGTGNAASAGNGGYMAVYGDATIYYLDMSGGWNGSPNPNDNPGTGGYLRVDGSIDGDGSIYGNGGERFGTLNAPGECNRPDASSVDVFGDMLCSHVELAGGDNTADYSAPEQVVFEFGPGPSLQQADYMVIYSDSDSWAFWVDIDENGTPPTGADYLAAGHQVMVGNLSTQTGQDTTNNFISAINTAMSGVATAANPGGMNSDVKALVVMVANGDVQDAVVHNANDSGAPSSFLITFHQNGGVNETNSDAGFGGNINVKGDSVLYVCYLYGGYSADANGGGGGSYVSKGRLHLSNEIDCSGGGSDAPVSGINGSAGYITAKDSLLARQVVLLDGDGGGGTANDSQTRLLLSGACHIGTLNMVDRPNSQINTYGNQDTASLQVSSLPNKATLNNANGDATANITNPGGGGTDNRGAIYTYDPTQGGWYAINPGGTPI